MIVPVPIRGVGRTARQLLVLACAALFVSDLCLSVQAMSPPHTLLLLPDLFRFWFWAVVGMIVLALMHGDQDHATHDAEHDAAREVLSLRWLPYIAIAVAFVVPAVGSWGDLGALEQHIPASGFLIVLILLRLGATSRRMRRW